MQVLSVVKHNSVIKIFQTFPLPLYTNYVFCIKHAHTEPHKKIYTPTFVVSYEKKTLYISISAMYIPFIGNFLFLNAGLNRYTLL